MLYFVSACSLALICFSGPKTGSKQGPKSPPGNSADSADRACHVIASSRRSRHPAFCLATRARRPRLRVTCAVSNPRGRVSHASASLLAGHLLNFLCSFYFCKLPFQSPSHSCPIKPETLNTQITASNGIKED